MNKITSIESPKRLVPSTKKMNYYKKTLIGLFEKLNIVHADPWKNIDLCHSIQRKLIEKIIYLEKNITKHKVRLQKIKSTLNKKDLTPGAKERSGTYKRLFKIYSLNIEDYKNTILVFKSIGDGLVHSYINKWEIKQFAFNSSPGYIFKKKGFELEKKIFEMTAHLKQPSILSDLTNCIRRGDLLIFNKRTSPLIIEAKTSKNENERTQRQEKHLSSLMDYLINGISENINPGITTVRNTLKTTEIILTIDLNKLLAKAKIRNSCIMEKIEPGLYYLVSYNSPLIDIKQMLGSEKDDQWKIYLINQYKYENPGHTPFAVSIKDPEALFDFYLDKCVICVFINFTHLKNQFAAEKINLAYLKQDRSLKIEKNGIEMVISDHFFERVPLEFISLKWFITEVLRDFHEGPPKLK